MKTKLSALKISIVSALLMASVGASAALPDWATTVGATMLTAIDDMEGMVAPAVVAVVVATLLIKLFKRFSNKV